MILFLARWVQGLGRWLGLARRRPDFAARLAAAIRREEGVMLRVSALERSLGSHRVMARRPSPSNPQE